MTHLSSQTARFCILLVDRANTASYACQINTFRVAFLLERMCPLEYGLGARFNETYFSYYNDAITAITKKGAYAILDPHNYMRYNDPSQQPATGSVIGNTSDPAAASTSQFQTFWNELAGRYKHNPNVIFGIMNEPHDMPTSLVLQNDQAAINGIRAAGAEQLIIAPGNGYTGGHVWNTTAEGDAPSADYLYMIRDPINNTAIDIHEYLDYDFSGQHSVCNQSFPANMYGLTEWLRTYQLKAMVTEFGGDNNTMCDQYLTQAVEYMADNAECKSLVEVSSDFSPLTSHQHTLTLMLILRHWLDCLGRWPDLGHLFALLQRRSRSRLP